MSKPGLRAFIEGRLAGYEAQVQGGDTGADSSFPDTAVSFAMAKVRADCLRRMLEDFDRAVVNGEYKAVL